MSTIAEPIRVNSFSELKEGDKIWSINGNGAFEIIQFVKLLDASVQGYAIFLNTNKDGIPKFYEERLKDEKWYKYDDSETTWYHIFSAQAKFYRNAAKECKERADWCKNAIENKEEEYSNV